LSMLLIFGNPRRCMVKRLGRHRDERRPKADSVFRRRGRGLSAPLFSPGIAPQRAEKL
jgi:hypothetical protein